MINHASEPFPLRINKYNRRLCQLLYIAENGKILPELYRPTDWTGTELGKTVAACGNGNELKKDAIGLLHTTYSDSRYVIQEAAETLASPLTHKIMVKRALSVPSIRPKPMKKVI